MCISLVNHLFITALIIILLHITTNNFYLSVDISNQGEECDVTNSIICRPDLKCQDGLCGECPLTFVNIFLKRYGLQINSSSFYICDFFMTFALLMPTNSRVHQNTILLSKFAFTI